MAIERYQSESPPDNRAYGDFIRAGIIRGNAGSLVLINLPRGELAEHSHEQEHVGAVLEGEFSFTNGAEGVRLGPGDVYRVPAGEPHGVRCARAQVWRVAGTVWPAGPYNNVLCKRST